MPSVIKFLLERMSNAGIGAIFGVPGDYILGAYKRIEEDPNIELIGTTDESHAGFAADAYARVHGIGCVCVTYNVGSLKVANPLAGAYAERSPVVLIVGSPGIKERSEGLLLHHTVRNYDTQREIFSNITCANTVLDNPTTAAFEIDRVFAALKHYRQPIYIELPRDIAEKPISYDIDQGTPVIPKSNLVVLEEAASEVLELINKASNPIILAGVELARFGLGEELTKFSEKTNLPVFTEILSKSVVGENHPNFGGVYSGNATPISVKERVENSDCVLMLGVMLTDMVLGSTKPNFILQQSIRANVNNLKIKNHNYTNIVFPELCKELFRSYGSLRQRPQPKFSKKSIPIFEPNSNKITTKRFFEKINSLLFNCKKCKNAVVITDVGDSLFGAIDLVIDNPNTFISPAYYTSMGMAIPAALGVCVAKPEKRPIVLVGDGAFQMSLSEISTLVRRGLNPIIFVLNNQGYTTERYLLDGKFNDIANWNYHHVDALFGGGRGYKVTTEQELEKAIYESINSHEVSIINVIVGSHDITDALKRITTGLKLL